MIDPSFHFKAPAIAQNWPSSAISTLSLTYTHRQVSYAQWSNTGQTSPRDKIADFCAISCNTNAELRNRAIDCTGNAPQLRSTELDRLIASSLTERTRQAYRTDLEAFEGWLGRTIPASADEVAEYLAAMATTLKPATLARRLASISKAHRARGLPSPVSSEIVRAAFRGVRRELGTAQRQAKPLLKDDLLDILDRLPETAKGIRDRALLLIGFAGGFRRSELIGIDFGHVEHVRQGIIVNLPRSKTDQEARGRKVGIPFGRSRHCPVKSLQAWLDLSGISAGAIFRPVSRHGQVERSLRLSGEAVAMIVKEAVGWLGFDPDHYSGHSLRAGLATSAAMAGVPTHKIRQTTGHASDAMLSRYLRDGDLFIDNAAGRLL